MILFLLLQTDMNIVEQELEVDTLNLKEEATVRNPGSGSDAWHSVEKLMSWCLSSRYHGSLLGDPSAGHKVATSDSELDIAQDNDAAAPVIVVLVT
ncbi:hypothetical protein ElyMa_000670100 [Elysia marginata]|uniref:Uncharacterized protein n=1 Tax=Elysia marginata TaxID=1093978 RepID=A0AAV4GIX9_9GAST|nr:hypothetical protein ElyMa_000670100 [Elysia marginata]